jgi:hypothetical protein
MTYFTYRLVPILAANYKQHILSPNKLRKYVIHYMNFMSDQFIWIYSGGAGREFHETA